LHGAQPVGQPDASIHGFYFASVSAARRSPRTLGVKTVRRTLSTNSSYPHAGQLPTDIDRAVRQLIPLPAPIRIVQRRLR
jgi:hypothetical protein